MENKTHNKKQHKGTAIGLAHKEHPNRLLTLIYFDDSEYVLIRELEYIPGELVPNNKIEYKLDHFDTFQMLERLLPYGYEKLSHDEIYS